MELRQDPTTRNWVLIGKIKENISTKNKRCPFCRGNEDLNPATIRAFYNQAGEWTVRVFPDSAPVFQIEGNLDKQAEGIFDKMNNIGAHEVITETPVHEITLSSLSTSEIRDILKMYGERITDLKKDRRFKYILIFKNQGKLTGSKINHLHSHIIATPVIPMRLEKELRWTREHYDMKGRCMFCDIIYQESKQKTRIVYENNDFISLCPFASRFPYEVWILPTIHNHSFENTVGNEAIVNSLAAALKTIISKIEKITTSYHIVFHVSPNESSFRTITGDAGTLADDFHWHIEILPRIEEMSRLQREEEFYINTMPPEEAAIELREK